VDVRLDHLRRASLAALAGLRGQDRAALVTFNQRATLQAPLTEQLERVRQAVERMEGGGGTALLDATYAGILVGESDMGRSLLMVFTDGADTSSFLTREAVLDSARRTDVVVYAVASGVGKRRSVLDDTVRQTGGALLELESTADMPAAFGRILEEFRQRYLLSYSPTGVERPGWHRIEVRVKGRRVEVKARQGYQVGGRRV
jgi:Ca-activated chloride channel family protein